MILTCKLCTWTWETRKEAGDQPAQCPRCKRYDWNKNKEVSSNEEHNGVKPVL